MLFLSNPYKLRASEKYAHKRTVLKRVFCEPLIYDKNKGFRTAAIARPFRGVGELARCDSGMAEREGFEPPVGINLRLISSQVH